MYTEKDTYIYSILEVVGELNSLQKGTCEVTDVVDWEEKCNWLDWRITKGWTPGEGYEEHLANFAQDVVDLVRMNVSDTGDK